jgi:hypothetical protein
MGPIFGADVTSLEVFDELFKVAPGAGGTRFDARCPMRVGIGGWRWLGESSGRGDFPPE